MLKILHQKTFLQSASSYWLKLHYRIHKSLSRKPLKTELRYLSAKNFQMRYKTFSHNAPEFRIQKFSQNNPNTINLFQQITSGYSRIQNRESLSQETSKTEARTIIAKRFTIRIWICYRKQCLLRKFEQKSFENRIKNGTQSQESLIHPETLTFLKSHGVMGIFGSIF